MIVGRIEAVLDAPAVRRQKGKIGLILTSPPFPLVRKKRYGNEVGETYLGWLSSLAPKLSELLTPDGSKRVDQPHLLARLIEVLREEGRGIHISEIHSVASAFSHPTISPHTIFSLATQDDRMSANSEQFLFLSEWGSARRDSLSVAISKLLSKAENGISFDEIVELAELHLQRSVNKGSVSKCLQTLNTRYDPQSEKWSLAPDDEQTLDEDDNVEDAPNLEQSLPASNSISKVPFPFLSDL
jgi:hypothetical protein